MVRSSSDKVIGWREWISLPQLGISSIKAKIDTGARTSSIHALNIVRFEREGRPWVGFDVCPKQRQSVPKIHAEAPLLGMRDIRSSNGHKQRRPVIETEVCLMGMTWKIELTLANRDQMGFRMLLGRKSLKVGFLVDAGASFLAGRPLKTKKKSRKSPKETE